VCRLPFRAKQNKSTVDKKKPYQTLSVYTEDIALLLFLRLWVKASPASLTLPSSVSGLGFELINQLSLLRSVVINGTITPPSSGRLF